MTECDLHYEGSISIDEMLIEAAGLLVNERVEIYNIDNGERFATYVIPAPRGSGGIGLNGAAARKACVGDKLIICAYAAMAAGRRVETFVFGTRLTRVTRTLRTKDPDRALRAHTHRGPGSRRRGRCGWR